jgi:hypothetical protein
LLVFCRKSDDDKQAIEHLSEVQDEEYLHSTNKSFFTYRPSVQIDKSNQLIGWGTMRQFKQNQ